MSEESDQGKYECVATNSDGTRYSTPANLYVRGKWGINESGTSRVHLDLRIKLMIKYDYVYKHKFKKTLRML